MKTHHLANVVLVLVMISAVIGMYYIFKGPGRAAEPGDTEVDTVGECCCIDGGGTPFMKPSGKTTSMTLPSDCVATCQESGARPCQ